MTQLISIIGLWHQGIVAASVFADFGFDVVAADSNSSVVDSLNSGKSPIFEPGLDELLQKGLASGRLRFTSDLPAAVQGRKNVWFMHDTPVDENDQPDISGILNDAKTIAPRLEPGALVVSTAQAPVGTCDELARLLGETGQGTDFQMAFIPENLRLGQAIERFRKPPLPVMGSDSADALARLENLLLPLSATWKRVSLRTAEMVKHALNAFLGVSICFANELGNICEAFGADGFHLAEALRLEPRIGPKAMLLPGLGFSGGTLARDMQTLRSLGKQAGLQTLMLDGAFESNAVQNAQVARRLRNRFGSLKNIPMAVWGLTYKPGTSTLRRSAALEIISALLAEGAKIAAHDPKAERDGLPAHEDFVFHDDPYEALRGARALVLITPWPEYKTIDLAQVRELMAEPCVFDTANLLDADRLVELGFSCLLLGRGRKKNV